jgi:hypothetical protein
MLVAFCINFARVVSVYDEWSCCCWTNLLLCDINYTNFQLVSIKFSCSREVSTQIPINGFAFDYVLHNLNICLCLSLHFQLSDVNCNWFAFQYDWCEYVSTFIFILRSVRCEMCVNWVGNGDWDCWFIVAFMERWKTNQSEIQIQNTLRTLIFGGRNLIEQKTNKLWWSFTKDDMKLKQNSVEEMREIKQLNSHFHHSWWVSNKILYM